MVSGAATIMIDRSADEVFAAVSDVTRMGEWSPECRGARWVPPATTAEVGARFEGDNVAKLGPVPLKKWTTTSEVTKCVPGEVFEFIASEYTRWRYEFVAVEGATRLTESYEHAPYEGWQHFVYDVLFRRQAEMVAGMEKTLSRIKVALETG